MEEYISSFGIRNFKMFSDKTFDLKSLNILSGGNSTGKTTLVEGMKLILDSYYHNWSKDNPEFYKCPASVIHQGEVFLEFSLKAIRGGELYEGSWFGIPDRKKNRIELYPPLPLAKKYCNPLFYNGFLHITPPHIDRILCQSAIFKASQNFINIKKLKHPNADDLSVSKNIRAWIEDFFPGLKLSFKKDEKIRCGETNVYFSYEGSDRITPFSQGANAVTYVFYLITELLTTEKEEILFVENPENYLHNSLQTKIGKLLAYASGEGQQIILETHSDHIFNGIRLAVYLDKVDPNIIQFYHFSKNKNGSIEVDTPIINKHGRINNWPDLFFDEWDKSLQLLLR